MLITKKTIMNRLKPGDKARVIGNEWVKCFKPPFWYQPDSGYIMDQDGLPVAEVRGWGTISYQDQAIDLHDQLGEDIAKGLNSVLNDEVIATQQAMPQGTEVGIPEPIEPVQEEESPIDWGKLREKFFKECTVKDSIDGAKIRIDYAPHDLFEWLKSEIEELKRKL